MFDQVFSLLALDWMILRVSNNNIIIHTLQIVLRILETIIIIYGHPRIC